MINKAAIFYNSILFVCFLLGLLVIGFSHILALIIIFFVLNGYLFISWATEFNVKKILWSEKLLKKNIVSHCDGVVESIKTLENFHNKGPHWAIKIINKFPSNSSRISPMEGILTIQNNMKLKNKEYQMEATVVGSDLTVFIGDNSCQGNKSIMDIFPNGYLLNDVTQIFKTNGSVKMGDNLWAMYFYSQSTIIIPADKGTPLVVENQTVIGGETFIFKLK